MQAFTRIIGSIHPTSMSSANQFILECIVDVNFYELIEGTMKERDEYE